MNKFAKLEIKLKDLNIEPLRIAKFFYQKGIFSHLVIQKLVYFSFLEGLKGDLLFFPEKFQAWKYGPVLVSIFEKMTNCSNLDEMFARISNLKSKPVLTILEQIYQTYWQWEVWDLVDKSHEGPWAKARGGLGTEETSTNEIGLKDLISFANAQK